MRIAYVVDCSISSNGLSVGTTQSLDRSTDLGVSCLIGITRVPVFLIGTGMDALKSVFLLQREYT